VHDDELHNLYTLPEEEVNGTCRDGEIKIQLNTGRNI
jgi:hypothetical protein